MSPNWLRMEQESIGLKRQSQSLSQLKTAVEKNIANQTRRPEIVFSRRDGQEWGRIVSNSYSLEEPIQKRVESTPV